MCSPCTASITPGLERGENSNEQPDRNPDEARQGAKPDGVGHRVLERGEHFPAALDGSRPVKGHEILEPIQVSEDVIVRKSIEALVLLELRACCTRIDALITLERICAKAQGHVHEECDEQEGRERPQETTTDEPSHARFPILTSPSEMKKIATCADGARAMS